MGRARRGLAETTTSGCWINGSKILGRATPSGAALPGRKRRQMVITVAAQLVGGFAQTHDEVRVDHVFPLTDNILARLQQNPAPTEKEAMSLPGVRLLTDVGRTRTLALFGCRGQFALGRGPCRTQL